jgi:hypothetical protein
MQSDVKDTWNLRQNACKLQAARLSSGRKKNLGVKRELEAIVTIDWSSDADAMCSGSTASKPVRGESSFQRGEI